MTDYAHTGLIVLAIFAGGGLVASFVAMDRYATVRDRQLFSINGYHRATRRLHDWSWAAMYASVVLAASLIALLIGA